MNASVVVKKKRQPAFLPLEGIRVLDFTEVLAGPYCTQMLGDLGADILKVEAPRGDGSRKYGPPFVGKDSAYFQSINRNKESIVVDLSKGNEGRKLILRLASECDILIESFRPGVMKKLGLGYDDIRKINRKIIYCSVSGYGQYGPLSHKPGYDIAGFAASGLMSITGEEEGSPVKVGVPIADIGAGMTAVVAILSALLEREKLGKGSYLDVSLYDTMMSWLTFQAAYFFATGKNPRKLGSAHQLIVPYQAFKAKDRYFILAVGNDSIWQRACKVLGLDHLQNDERFATSSSRVINRKELIEILDRVIEQRKAKYWLDKFDKAGVPSSPINTVKEALESSHTRRRNLVLTIGSKGFRTIALPIHVKHAGNNLRKENLRPPRLGENSAETLKRFGFGNQEIRKLSKNKIVGVST